MIRTLFSSLRALKPMVNFAKIRLVCNKWLIAEHYCKRFTLAQWYCTCPSFVYYTVQYNSIPSFMRKTPPSPPPTRLLLSIQTPHRRSWRKAGGRSIGVRHAVLVGIPSFQRGCGSEDWPISGGVVGVRLVFAVPPAILPQPHPTQRLRPLHCAARVIGETWRARVNNSSSARFFTVLETVPCRWGTPQGQLQDPHFC